MPMEVSTDLPCLDRRGRAAVSQMKRDDVRLLASEPAQSAVAKRDVAVRSAVESITPDAMTAVEMIGNGVEVSFSEEATWWKEVSNTATCGTSLPNKSRARDDPLDIVGVVQGRKIDAVFDSLEDAIVDQGGLFEQLSAVHHAMADRMHVSGALDLGNARSIRCQESY